MIGFRADARAAEIRVDQTELEVVSIFFNF
jgi:NADH pyrophosphatase NudC (nudix superfamily)